jgi:hypothetical protein
MARLFIRHKPIAYDVEESVQSNRFYVSREILNEHGIRYEGPNNTDVAYVCIVHAGNCWAARYFTQMGNKQIRVDCVPFSDDPSGQEMIFADMILN